MKKCPYCGEEIQDKAKKCRYCGEWLESNKQIVEKEDKKKEINEIKEEQVENKKEINEKPKTIVDFKSKLVNFIILTAYFLLTVVLAALYSYGSKSLEVANGKPEDLVSYFIVVLIFFFFVGKHYYKKSRGDLLPTLKENIKKFLKGLIPLTISLLILFALLSTQMDVNNENTKNDMENFVNTTKNVKIDPNGDNKALLDSINSIETDSGLGKSMQNYMNDKFNINSTYHKEIENLGNIYIPDGKEDDLSFIKDVKNNLKNLKIISGNYQKGHEELISKYPNLKGLYDSDNLKKIDELEKLFFNKENGFIEASIEMCDFLIEYHDEVIISNGQAVMEGSYSQTEWEEHLNNYIVKEKEYNEADENLQNYRKEFLEKSMKQLQNN